MKHRQKCAPLLVKDSLLFEHLGKDRHGRVDGVGDDEDHGFGAMLGTRLSQGVDDRGVGVLEDGH